MRKLWALALCATSISLLQAQLPSGSTAPDFTAKDLNGQTWRLYDLLDQGKTVVLEMSATWCPPCWAYHNGHAMHNFYAQHGPLGDDKARVLFVEGDPKTNVECLYGTAGCNNYSPGNWVAGTPFPIFDNAAIADTFQVTYYPTIFVICPNRKLYEVGQWNAADLWNQAKTCPVALGNSNAGIFDYDTGTPLHEVCGALETTPSFALINLGQQALTQATVALRWDNQTVQTIEWSGNLGLYGETKVQFDPLPLSGAGTLETRLLRINNANTDDDPANNTHADSFTLAREFNDLKVLLKIRTDQYGAETYWELRDEQGLVLESGGNQAVGPDGGGMLTGINTGPGAYGNNALIRDTLHLPGPGCYSIHFVDAYGDGMCCNYGLGYYKLYNLDDPATPILWGGAFRAYDDRGFSAGMVTPSREAAAIASGLSLFPNPVREELFLMYDLLSDARVSLTVYNTLGQLVRQEPPVKQPAGEQQMTIPVGDLPAGLYWLTLNIGHQTITQKFMVQKSP